MYESLVKKSLLAKLKYHMHNWVNQRELYLVRVPIQTNLSGLVNLGLEFLIISHYQVTQTIKN